MSRGTTGKVVLRDNTRKNFLRGTLERMGCALAMGFGALAAMPVAALGWAVGWAYEAYGLPAALALAGGGAVWLWFAALGVMDLTRKA